MSKWKSISRYSLVHLLPTSSSKSAPDPTVIFNDFYVKPSSCYSPVRILSTSSSKSVLTVFYDFYVKSSSRYSPVHFFATTFPDRAAKPGKQRLSFGDHGSHFTPQKQGCAPDSVFKPEFTRSRSLTLPSYLRDDVVAMMIEMMMWLPSW